MSFIPDYLAAGIDQPDFDLRVVPIFEFRDERQCIEWFDKTRKARSVTGSLSGRHDLDIEQRRGIVAGITGLSAPDPRYSKRSVGIDTGNYRLPGFLLTRTVAGAPSLHNVIGIASKSLELSEPTIWRLWRSFMPIAHRRLVRHQPPSTGRS